MSALYIGEWQASYTGHFTAKEKLTLPIGQEAGWAPETVWALWSREKFLDSAGNRTPVVQRQVDATVKL
jgi:hypothetical protein